GEIQHIGGKSAVKQHVPIGQARSAHQQLVAHEAAVEKGKLQVRLAARECRQRQPSRQLQGLGLVLELDDMIGEILAAYSRDAFQALGCSQCGLERPDVLAVVNERESDI